MNVLNEPGFWQFLGIIAGGAIWYFNAKTNGSRVAAMASMALLTCMLIP